MKIAYVTTYDATDIHTWSGSAYYIRKTLQEAGYPTTDIGKLQHGTGLLGKFKQVVYPKIIRKKYLRDREPRLLAHYARQVESQLAQGGADIVFTPGSLPIARLKTDKPIVMWTDTTFAGLIDFYPNFTNLCDESLADGHRFEQAALDNCRLIIFSSDWAARTALDHYALDPAKVKVVPFGANVSATRTAGDIQKIAAAKSLDVCKLLFVGVDWVRKGGDVALAVAGRLTQRGIRTELHVVGCAPPTDSPGYVIRHGFISKRTPEGQAEFEQLMRDSHFLILPSLAECAAVAFAEASSFGLPSVASNVGGITTIVRDGRNGMTFPLGVDPDAYADYIALHMASRERYERLAASSFDEYALRLNWPAAGRAVSGLIQEFCV